MKIFCQFVEFVSHSNHNPLWKVGQAAAAASAGEQAGRGGGRGRVRVLQCIVKLPTDKFTGKTVSPSLSLSLSLSLSFFRYFFLSLSLFHSVLLLKNVVSCSKKFRIWKRSLSRPKIRGSNPVVGNFVTIVIVEMKIKIWGRDLPKNFNYLYQ